MAAPLVNATVRVVGKEIVDQKLRMAAPHILETNLAMVKGMLEYMRPLVEVQTPYGPGHFGYHLRDMYKIDVAVKPPISVIGVFKAPIQGYWREYGTRGRSRRRARALGMSVKTLVAAQGGGERAFMTAHKTLSATKRMVNVFYGGMSSWWRA